LTTSRETSDSKCNDFVAQGAKSDALTTVYPVSYVGLATDTVTAAPSVVTSVRITIIINVSISSFVDDDFMTRVAAVVGLDASNVVILRKRQWSDGIAVTFQFTNTAAADEKLNEFERNARNDASFNAAYPVVSVGIDDDDSSATRTLQGFLGSLLVVMIVAIIH
jgi:hypothetical protein